MFEMAKTSVVLFMHGRLFKDTNKVMRQVAFGILVTALILTALAAAGAPIWAAAAVAGLAGGALQPLLFKDLKYR